jgi:hypothetical protein
MPTVMAVIKLLLVVIRELCAARLTAWHSHDRTDLFLCQAVLCGPMQNALLFASLVSINALSAAGLAPALQAVQALGSFVELANRLDQPAL